MSFQFPPSSGDLLNGASSPQLQTIIAAIPFANDGDVVTREHHNTLRSALAAVAGALDETQLARVQKLSFTPALLPVVGSAAWRISIGVSVGPSTGDGAQGWMALDLPHGTTVDTMTVLGKMPQEVTIWTVALRRVELVGALQRDVCFREIQSTKTDPDGSFVVDAQPSTDKLSPVLAAELRRVDNTRYRYLFHTAMAGAKQADALELRLVQVTCTRG